MATHMFVERGQPKFLGSLGTLGSDPNLVGPPAPKTDDWGWLADAGKMLLQLAPMAIQAAQSWFRSNPQSSPEEIVKPINAGQYATRKAVADYLKAKLGLIPSNARPAAANMVFAQITNRTPEIARGFRDAAREFPDLKALVNGGAYGKPGFMERWGTWVIIGATVVVVGGGAYWYMKRRR